MPAPVKSAWPCVLTFPSVRFLSQPASKLLPPQYGTVGTPEKYFLKWKEDEQDNTRFKLDKYLLKICRKDRLIELMHDFVLFDGGIKKLPRVHQYFGIKAAREHVRQRKGGIIWHTQPSLYESELLPPF